MVPLNNPKRFATLLQAWLLICTSVLSPIAHAQVAPDTESPIIELEALGESPADRTQVFTALVADDRQIKNVSLYYRRAGQRPFTSVGMRPLGSTGYFTVSIKTAPNDLRAIEYYVQARDESGNRSVSGYAFEPHVRELTPLAQPLASTADEQGSSATGRTRWWAVALGVLTVGALAALANDGGDSGSDGGGQAGGENPGSVPLTLTIESP